MAKEKVVVKTRADAATTGFFQGNREQLIAHELRGQGIPAVGHHKTGITVEHGSLEVECEEGTGLHVFTWTPGEEQPAQQPGTSEGAAVQVTDEALLAFVVSRGYKEKAAKSILKKHHAEVLTDYLKEQSGEQPTTDELGGDEEETDSGDDTAA